MVNYSRSFTGRLLTFLGTVRSDSHGAVLAIVRLVECWYTKARGALQAADGQPRPFLAVQYLQRHKELEEPAGSGRSEGRQVVHDHLDRFLMRRVWPAGKTPQSTNIRHAVVPCFTLTRNASPKPTLYIRTVTVAFGVRSIVSPLQPYAHETARTSCVARRARWSAVGPLTPPRLELVVATHHHIDHISSFADPAWVKVQVDDGWGPTSRTKRTRTVRTCLVGQNY